MTGSGILAAATLAITAFQAAPPPSQPQQPPQQPPAASADTATQLDDVVVDARSVGVMVNNFVDEVIAAPPGRGPARWDRTVCVGVANLRPVAAQQMIDRVSQIAMDVGLEPGEPGCKPNVLVVVTTDGAGMARGLAQARPLAFRPGVGGSTRGSHAFDVFRNSDRPVRWWHVSLPVDSETGAPAVRMRGEESGPAIDGTASRLRTTIRNDLRRVFIIVDFDQAASVTFQQLSDYVAMVALSQVDPDAETRSYDTVLNVFDNPHAAEGLTDWDLAYLKSLYTAELNQRMPGAQGGAIGSIMTRDRTRAQQADAAGDAPADPDPAAPPAPPEAASRPH